MSEFHAFVEELFAALGPVRVKRMFGGAGVYCGELMFGLVIDDELYLKVDEETKARFEAEGLTPFVYEAKNGKHLSMSYYACPPRLLDEPDDALAWGRQALGAAQRAKAKPAKAKRRKK